MVGKDYFTRFTFREEKNEHSTTNYSRGSLVPINTPVKLVSMSGNKLTLRRADTGQEIKVENEPKYTKRTIAENRIDMAKGRHSVYWDFEIGNVMGSDFELNVIKVWRLALNRRK